MFKFTLLFVILLTTLELAKTKITPDEKAGPQASYSQGLPPALKQLHDQVSTMLRQMGVKAARDFEGIRDGVDTYRTELIKSIVREGYKSFHQIDIFKQEYVALGQGPERAPVKGAGPPGSCQIDPMEDVWHRSQNADRVVAHCILKYISSLDKISHQVHQAEREFVHKLYHIESRIKQCVTHFQGTPGPEHQIGVCLKKIGDDGQQLEKDVLPKVYDHFELMKDFFHHEETNIQHCIKEADIEYFQMKDRTELHHKFQHCP